MPNKYDRCVKQVKEKIKNGEIAKTYKKKGKRYRTNPYKICSKVR